MGAYFQFCLCFFIISDIFEMWFIFVVEISVSFRFDNNKFDGIDKFIIYL